MIPSESIELQEGVDNIVETGNDSSSCYPVRIGDITNDDPFDAENQTEVITQKLISDAEIKKTEIKVTFNVQQYKENVCL